MYIPLIGRVSLLDWPVIFFSLFLAWLEFIINGITALLPNPIISLFTTSTQLLLVNNPLKSFKSSELPAGISQKRYEIMIQLANAKDIMQMTKVFGYGVEPHVIKTKDEYILTLHRITGPERTSNGKVIYLHHGLLMCSEIWVTMLDKYKNLPYLLYDLGYDVWLGNNRGNKYSQKHINHSVNSRQFWNFSMDDYALFDIPDSIEYVLQYTDTPKLTYIGFSQGTAQAFASMSINPDLNSKIEQFIAISPATTPNGLTSSFLDVLVKTSPNVMYLLFGRKVLMPSVVFWNNVVYPTLFDRMIDLSNYLLFNWKLENVTKFQKLASYAHLYSTTSVKVVVHWFQIMKTGNFQMYHDGSKLSGTNPTSYNLQLIKTPIHLLYGDLDSLVDINIMREQLPRRFTTVHRVENHEHLDNLWGDDVYEAVFKHVLEYLGEETYIVDSLIRNDTPSIEEIIDETDSNNIDESYLKSANRKRISDSASVKSSGYALKSSVLN